MIFGKLNKIWENIDYPFLQEINGEDLYFNQISKIEVLGIEKINSGDVVVLIGDFNANSIATLLKLIEKNSIVVPLTNDTFEQHEYFIKESFAQYVFKENILIKTISNFKKDHILLNSLREKIHPGLILFTTGTTGRPKAILHDFIPFIERYKTPRPPMKALAFLLFDHIGGINTLLHMLFNQGRVVSIKKRTVQQVIKAINDYSIELLPTTPTFLRMMSLYPNIENHMPNSLKIISYGTERMDQNTLDILTNKLPLVDFRQTYGMSELGILRIKSKSRNSLFMKISGEGISTKIVDNLLYINAKNKMLGYLNSNSPFKEDGWYCTKDLVEIETDGFLKIVGRDSDVINIGGLKFMPSEVELECLKLPFIKHAKAVGKPNPFTGEHLELYLEVNSIKNKDDFKNSTIIKLKKVLPKHMIPSRIHLQNLKVSHRFKKL